MQSGGGLPPFASYTPVMANNAQTQYYTGGYDYTNRKSSKSSGEDDTKGEITNKDLLTMLKDIDGLPSDMKVLYSELSKFFQLQDLGIDTASLSMQYLRAIEQIKLAKYNKEVFDEAYKVLESNGGLNEYAISESGKLIGINDKEELRQMTYQELQESKEFHPITNAELLQLRAESPDKAFQNTLSQIASNGIGIEKVSELIKNNLYKLGTNEESYEGFITGKDNQQGLQLLKSLMASDKVSAGTDLDGLYKAKVVTKEQLSKIKGVLDYAYTMLPKNAKTLLAIKNEGSIEKSYNLIYQMLVGTANTSSEISLDYIEDAYGNKPGSKTKDQEYDKQSTDLFTNIIRGEGGTFGKITLQDKDGNTLHVNGTVYPSLSLDPSKSLHEGTLKDLLEYGYSSITKGGDYAITFGNQVIPGLDQDNITFLNDQQAIRTILPITRDEVTGKIIPDLDFMTKNADLIDLINKNGLQDREVIRQLSEKGIVNQFTGLPDLSKFQSYLCINGLGTSQTLVDGGHYTLLSGKEEEVALENFKRNTYKKKGEGDGKEYNFDFNEFSWYNPLEWFGNYDKMYKGTIYIPLTENALQTKIGAGTSVKESSADKLEEIYQTGNARRLAEQSGMKSNSSNILFN